jgi:predicted tellurium resistance membrane protein TerC
MWDLQKRAIRFGWVLYLAGMVVLLIAAMGILLCPWLPEHASIDTLLLFIIVGIGMALLGRDFRQHGW